MLAELDGETPATRSLLLACRALSEYGDDAARAVCIAFGADAAALDAELASRGDDIELQARHAKTRLDLARRRFEARAGGAELLLEDLERSLALALEADPAHAEWWIERARTAYFRLRFADGVEYDRRALALGDASPDDPFAIEALRWPGSAPGWRNCTWAAASSRPRTWSRLPPPTPR